MSFDSHKKEVSENDTIILLLGRNHVAVEINSKQNKTVQSKFGAFHHKDIIGKAYGNKINSSNGKGWAYILRATPELWTITLPHRTQILYTTDISMITFELELKPGSVVIESGTGSGSLSHAIIRTIKPNGHLFTFDFHQNRVAKAKEEFDNHFGVDKYVTCACADAIVDGFSMEDKADAVFLDLPAPWDAIKHAKTALKKSGGRLCSFSPCIEQVQRTCVALRNERFCEIKTVECLVQSLCVSTKPIPTIEFEGKQNDDSNNEVEAKKVKLEGNSDASTNGSSNGDMNLAPEEVTESTQETTTPVVTQTSNKVESTNDITGYDKYGMVTKHSARPKKGNVNVLTCQTPKETTGHTGYLTFASWIPFENESVEI